MFQGGIKAVMWTDVLQLIIMCGGMAAVVVGGFIQNGGIAEVFSVVYNGERVQFLE